MFCIFIAERISLMKVLGFLLCHYDSTFLSERKLGRDQPHSAYYSNADADSSSLAVYPIRTALPPHSEHMIVSHLTLRNKTDFAMSYDIKWKTK